MSFLGLCSHVCSALSFASPVSTPGGWRQAPAGGAQQDSQSQGAFPVVTTAHLHVDVTNPLKKDKEHKQPLT
jgi:hypothetical protein